MNQWNRLSNTRFLTVENAEAVAKMRAFAPARLPILLLESMHRAPPMKRHLTWGAQIQLIAHDIAPSLKPTVLALCYNALKEIQQS